MRKKFLLILGLLSLLSLCVMTGCSSEDDPVVPTNPQIFNATGNFHNFLVADGSVDTRLSFRQGPDINLANHIVPNGTATNRNLLLDNRETASAINFFLTDGDGTLLNQGEVFNLTADARYVFMALGHLYTVQGQTRPTLLQLDALAAPPAGQVAFRFTHALAGTPGSVDVHVNDQVIQNLVYGKASNTLVFSAREPDKDSLIVVPTGVDPAGGNTLIQIVDQSLFLADRDYEAILAHLPRLGFNGDINGGARLFLHESQ
jgi:hypothetical protein